MTTPPGSRQTWRWGGWTVLIVLVVCSWACGFFSAVVTLLGG